MNAAAFLASDICPYDGRPVSADRPHEQPAGIVLQEAWAEPMWVRVPDPRGSGFAKDYVPAPPLRCYSCGAQTSRSVPIAVHVTGHLAGELQLQLESRAECPKCGRLAGAKEVA